MLFRARSHIVAGLIVALVLLGLGGSDAFATTSQSSSLAFLGAPGDYISGGISTVVSTPSYTVSTAGPASYFQIHFTNATDQWGLIVAPPSGKLASGQSFDARQPGAAIPGDGTIYFFGDGRACNLTFGHVNVTSVIYGASGGIKSLMLNFVQHCESPNAPELAGRLHLNTDSIAKLPTTTTTSSTTTSSTTSTTVPPTTSTTTPSTTSTTAPITDQGFTALLSPGTQSTTISGTTKVYRDSAYAPNTWAVGVTTGGLPPGKYIASLSLHIPGGEYDLDACSFQILQPSTTTSWACGTNVVVPSGTDFAQSFAVIYNVSAGTGTEQRLFVEGGAFTGASGSAG